MNLQRKKGVHEIDRSKLVPPKLEEADWAQYLVGVELFNAGRFWDAHEAWEEVWKRTPEESRIFFQGIIQAAAAYHLIVTKPRFTGARNNFDKSLSKLELFSGRFLGVDVERFREDLERSRALLEELGEEGIRRFPRTHLPVLLVDKRGRGN
jgi:predicted metal-dependent hydrolase